MTGEFETHPAAVTAEHYVPSRRVWMKAHPTLTEKWLQQQIVEEPAILGLGEVDVKDIERTQPRAGRLDLLLYDAEATTRYELELQLGPTDESHIIRTIEYWDIERRRYPQYDHVGVIVAEEITARFFNVISLFNGFIPLVAIQVSAIEVSGALTLVFTKVLDTQLQAIEEEEPGVEPRDRSYWENKASPKTLAITDRILKLVHEVEPRALLNYNKYYVGLVVDGVASNFVTMRPRKQHVGLNVKTPRDDELTQRLEDAGMTLLQYQTRYGNYSLQITDSDLEEHADLLRELIKLARSAYGSPR
jgi:hypothetical protein